MTNTKKKGLIILFLIVCFVSAFFGGATFAGAASTEMAMTININEGGKTYSAADMLNACTNKPADIDDADAITDIKAYDEYVAKFEKNPNGTVTVTPKRIGKTRFVATVTHNGTATAYTITVYTVAQLIDEAEKTVSIGATIYEGVTTTVDFVNTMSQNTPGNLICVKSELANIGITAFARNEEVTDGNIPNGINMRGYIDTSGDDAVENAVSIDKGGMFGFSFMLKEKHGSSVTIPIVFSEPEDAQNPKSVTVKFRFLNPSAVVSAPVEKGINELSQVFYSTERVLIKFNDLFQTGTLSGGSNVIIQNANVIEGTYNTSRISVAVYTDPEINKITGLYVTPKANGTTQITISYYIDGSSAVSTAKSLTIPVEVNGIYSFQSLSAMTGVEKTFSVSDEVFKQAETDGYVFAGVEGECSVADVTVVGGKLVIRPKEAGNGNITATMVKTNAIDPESTRITVTIPINISKFNLFTYLSTAGVITMFTVGGLIVLVLIVMLILSIIRHKKNKKLKQQIIRNAESKLQQKQEIQQRQRASMMQMSAMYNSMMRPQGLALNAAGGSMQRPNTLAIGAGQSVKSKPILEINTAAGNSGYDANTAKAEGSKKADAFMEEVMAKAKRDAKLKEEQEKRLKEDVDKARRAAKIKQQQDIAARQAEQKRAMEEEKAKQQEKLDSDRERLEAEKLKMQQEKDKMYLDTKRTEVINLNASLLDLYRQLASIDKLLFVKDMELEKIGKNITLSTERMASAENHEDGEKISAEINELQSKQSDIKTEINELESQAGGDDERRSKEESHIDAIVAECKFEDLKVEFERQRTELMRKIEQEYERYTKDYKNEFNTKEALEQAEKLRQDMIAQTERTKQENLRKAIQTKLATINGIIGEIDEIADLTKLAQQEGKLNGVLAALLPEEMTDEVDAQIAEAQNKISIKRNELEALILEAQANENRERREAGEREARELAAQMSEILKSQFEIDKQTYLDNFNKNRAEARMKTVREKLAVSGDDEEVTQCNAELRELNDALSNLNTNLVSLELQSNRQAGDGEALENKLEAIIRENELDDVKKEIDYQSEILQRDLNAEYQKFVAKHREDVARQDAMDEAERVRRQMQEQADRIKREAFNELMKSRMRTAADLLREIEMADTADRLQHYADSLNDFASTLREEEKTKEMVSAIDSARAAASAKKIEIAERAKQEAEAKRVAEENAAKIKSAVEAKRRELLGIKGEIPAVADMAGANVLLAKLAAFNDGLSEELRVPEILVPIDKVHDSIVHAGEMAELRKTKVPQKKVIKKVVNNINRIKRPAPKKPGTPGARPAGARPAARPAGARPAGARPAARPAGARPAARPAGARPAARPAGARPAGARPAARPSGARPAGARPAARPAGARPAARPAGNRPAPKR